MATDPKAGGAGTVTTAEKGGADKAGASGAPVAAASPAAVDASKGGIFARRGMWRAGIYWAAGFTPLTEDLVAKLEAAQERHDEDGPIWSDRLTADPNFSIVQSDPKGSTMIDGEGQPIDAHTIVLAKRGMWRGGKLWAAGANALDEEQAAALAAKPADGGPSPLDLVKADTGNFTVVQPTAAAKSAKAAKAPPPAAA
jgi:hypothetical protein